MKAPWILQLEHYTTIQIALVRDLQHCAREARLSRGCALNWLPVIRRTAAALAYWRRVYYGSLPTTGMEYPAFTTLTLTGPQGHNQKETQEP
jgi:hypothetical protein